MKAFRLLSASIPVSSRRTPVRVLPLAAMATLASSDAVSAAATADLNGTKTGLRVPKRTISGGNTQASWRKKKTKREKNITEGSSEEVLRYDIEALLESRGLLSPNDAPADGNENTVGDGEAQAQSQAQAPAPAEVQDQDKDRDKDKDLPAPGTEVEVEVLELSSTGDGLAMRPGSDQVYVVPFTVPGDVAKVKVYRHLRRERQTVADFISITTPSPLRDDSRVRCKYFSRCGGCQFQMLDYAEQLRLKRRIVDKAFRNFANLPPHLVPAVLDTIGSPLQYGYRTKLTPHFDGPPGHRQARRHKEKPKFEACPDIGFMVKGQRRVMDIEDCPIGTDIVRMGMRRERERMHRDFGTYTRGATLLLRENTQRFAAAEKEEQMDQSQKSNEDEIQDREQKVPPPADQLPPYTVRVENPDGAIDIKTCETDSKATTHEYIRHHHFTNPAGSFFQNNNSILPIFTDHVRQHVLPPPPSSSSSSPSSSTTTSTSQIKYLIDAYSGSGLFTITLASVFRHSTGIDIAADSIASARHNASLNGLAEDRCRFIAADAGELFKNVEYNPDETVVILDPPRKGCDESFLAQLRRFGPRRVVYVSCNVHTQARDVGVLVRGEGEGRRYEIESLRGFDFFPQTGHVEGFAILNRVEE